MGATQLRIVVAMTTCEGAEYLPRQLASIADQDRPPDALVVGDDASTDATRVIVTRFAEAAPFPVMTSWGDARTGLQRNAEQTLRRALDHADVIVLADQDDLWHPGKISALATAFESDPDLAMWSSDAELIDPHDARLGSRLWEFVRLDPAAVAAIDAGDGLGRLVHGQTFTGPTMAVRTSVVERALPLPHDLDDEELLFQPDGWLAVLARVSGRIVSERHPFTSYRRHPRQLSASTGDPVPSSRATRRTSRRVDLRRHQARVHLVAERVRDADVRDWEAEVRAELLELDRFLTARTAPGAGPRRWRLILAEGRAGTYRRHANGTRTLLADLIRRFPAERATT
jgi:glycosyltransferase involved in cell wall biosynthesis